MTSSSTARFLALGAIASLAVAGCSTASATGASDGDASSAAAAAGTFFDASTVHSIAIDVEQSELTTAIESYLDSGDKVWITADVTIDGVTYSQVGLKLKGNSSLRSISTDSAAQDLPWRIRLDKFVDGQNADGYTDLVLRANSSETSINEAVALDLLAEAGLATERAVATRVSVNGSEETLVLVLQNLDDTWFEENFSSGDILYKADAEGDYTWRGDDPTAYAEAFDVEVGDEDYTPLVTLLDLVNNGSDEDFATQLPELLDVESFARYLAFEDLINNFDDIDGPGNNSYLAYDSDTGVMTVVAWDHNLAFGVANGGMGGEGGFGGGGMGGPGGAGADSGRPAMPERGEIPEGMTPSEGMTPPEGMEFPEGFEPPTDGQMPNGMGGAGMGGDNPLVERFLENEDFEALYNQATTDLTAELVDSGALADSVATWTQVLQSGAADLVDEATIQKEADAVAAYAKE